MNSKSERYPIAQMLDNDAIGIVKQLGAHVSIVEFEDGYTRWSIVVENDDYEIIDYITIGLEELDG